MVYCACDLHQAAAEHVGRRSVGSGVGELGNEPTRFGESFVALRATGGEMSFERGAFGSIERAEGVGFEKFAELVGGAHVAACNPSRRRLRPLRIQLLTVPSGSLSMSAISVWLRPSK